MEFKYDVDIEIRGEEYEDRRGPVVSPVRAYLYRTLKDVAFPNPVTEGMFVEITVPSKDGGRTFHKDVSLTNIARHEGEGGFTTRFSMDYEENMEGFKKSREDLEDYGFTYSRKSPRA